MRASPKYKKISTWLKDRYGEKVFKVSLRGGFTCPNRDGTVGTGGCSFCLGKVSEPLGYHPKQSIKEQLTKGMEYIRARHRANRFVAYFHDYSATYGKVEDLRKIYDQVLSVPEVVAMAVGTRPDCLSEPIIDLLCDINQKIDLWIEIGLQIANNELLKTINRGHSVDDFIKAVKNCHKHNLLTCAHVIVGFPGATINDEQCTADLLSELGVWGVKIHAFHVLRNTPMEAKYESGDISVLSLEEYVVRAVNFIERLPPNIVIHRLTAEAPRHFTVAPKWTINKLAVYNAVIEEMRSRQIV